MSRWVYFIATHLAFDFFSMMLQALAILKAPLSQEFGFQGEFLGTHQPMQESSA